VLVEPSDPEQGKTERIQILPAANRRGAHKQDKNKDYIMKNITREHQRDKREPTKTLGSEKLLFRELVVNYNGKNSYTKLYLSIPLSLHSFLIF
jgi:hypothetical protein